MSNNNSNPVKGDNNMPWEQDESAVHMPMQKAKKVIYESLGDGRLSGFVFAEVCTIYYSLLVWFKKPAMPQARYSVFTYHRESQLKVLVVFFSILIGVEAALLHFLLSMWNAIVSWALLALNIYGILYIIALYQSSRHLPHLLSNDLLYLCMGLQSAITVSLDNIEHFRKARPIDLTSKIEEGIYLSYLRFDTPQFEIVLKNPVQIKTLHGAKKTISVIIFRVDNPQMFLREWGMYREGELL